MIKKILGLDLGTNSIGWALVKQDFNQKEGEIDALGSRIIPMDQKQLTNFEQGNTVSATAQRTEYRSVRRLYQRDNLRRERLHRVLNILGYLPEHYKNEIDFEIKLGQFKKEVKLNYKKNDEGKFEFIFKKSFNEMVKDFKEKSIDKIPYDWTIYYLRKKALTKEISNEELAWILLNFNQKRGYYQLRGENEIKTEKGKTIETYDEKVVNVKKIAPNLFEITLSDGTTYKEESSYQITFENDLREIKLTAQEKINKKTKEVEIVKTKEVQFLKTFKVVKVIDTDEVDKKYLKSYKVLLDNGSEFIKKKNINNDLKWEGKLKTVLFTYKIGNNSNLKISAPEETNWTLIKKKTEQELEQYIGEDNKNRTVGTFIYETLLQKPNQKIRGKLIKTIERKYYKQELEAILEKQMQFKDALQYEKLFTKAINELYKHNDAHKKNLSAKDFKHLFIEDIIFYQRPLKSQKRNIGGCQFEKRPMRDKDGNLLKDEKNNQIYKPVKAVSKSHPLFQEFRLWQWLHNLKIYDNDDKDVTKELIPTEKDWTDLFDFLIQKKEIDLKGFLKYFSDKKLIPKQARPKKGEQAEYTHRWNYPEDKTYPMGETHSSFISRLSKVKDVNALEFLTPETEQHLWHIIYSVSDAQEYKQALIKFANKNNLDEESFLKAFIKYPPFKSDFASYSLKAIKKLLPLMRMGKYWNVKNIDENTLNRIDKIIYGEVDEKIQNRVREKAFHIEKTENFKGLPTWLASYIVYDRHSESGDIQYWKTPQDIDKYLNNFKQHSLRNPIVEQVVLETLRTVRDIWQYYGEGKENFFDEIHVELGRDMKNPADKRKKISDRNLDNERTNTRIRKLLEELIDDGAKPTSPSHQEILKIYEEGVFNNSPNEYKKIKLDDIEKIRKNNTPSQKDIQKYKLWLEQKYISPYTGEPIPLSDLFSEKYQIEHIIPQSRYFDNSMTNKVICESAINPAPYKNNQTAYEFIKKMGGQIVPELSTKNKTVRILEWDEYETHCKTYFKKNKNKLKNLLTDEIPEGFINRQLNDSRYISKLVKGLLSNIVREEGEQEPTSKNLLPVTGAITSKLKHDWGLNDKWNELILPRFKRLNKLTNSNDYTYFNEQGIEVPTVPSELKTKFNKKRIDHRHHALDALVIACCTRKHIQYINSLNNKKEKYDLQPSLMIKNKEGHYTKYFQLPWQNFPIDAKNALDKTIVSFKQNLRVINKTNNKYWKYVKQKDGSFKKELVDQKGNNFAIRKSLHTPLPYGKNKYNFTVLEIARNIGKKEFIKDDKIREKVEEKLLEFGSIGKTEKELKKNPLIDENGKQLKFCVFNIPQIRYRKRKPITDLANRGQGGIKTTEQAINFIRKVSDLKLQSDLLQHLKDNKYDINKAFSIEGIEEFNNKREIPVYKLPISEPSTKKFQIGEKNENAKVKFGEADSDSNLFFAIYLNNKGEREYETVPLNEVIVHQKSQAKEKTPKEKRTPIPVKKVMKKRGEEIDVQFLFSLSPNDLVYVPTDEEIENPNLVYFNNLSKEQMNRIYKMVSSSGNQCFFVKSEVSTPIVNKKEFSALNKMEKSIDGKMIKTICWKLKTDRLGNISLDK